MKSPANCPGTSTRINVLNVVADVRLIVLRMTTVLPAPLARARPPP
jgi:hypothetical protein